ncbi:MAG: extracellular solute-binding protein [Lachnospiraceae bacterium]|nr:extracellular solute-binding protein [Lachnospiraceae bacterium]
MKKQLAAMTAGILAAGMLLSGCGGSGESQTAPAAGDAGASESGEVSGTLTFLSWYNQSDYQPILDAFNEKYPNVEIDFQNVSTENNQYSQRLTLLANSGELPDVFYIQPPIAKFAKEGYLMELDDLDAMKDISGTYRDTYTYEGKTCAFVDDAWIGGVYYDKDMFEANGLSVPETYDEFLNICKTFYDQGIRPVSISGTSLPDLMYWIHDTEVLAENPDYDKEIDDGQHTFTEGYLDNINQWKKDFVDTGYMDEAVVGYSDEQRLEEFASGEAAMTISGPWSLSTIRAKAPDKNVGIFPFVGSKGQKYTVGAVNVGIAISANAKNPAAAKAFMNFLAEDETMLLYQQLTGNFMVKDVGYEVDEVLTPLVEFANNGQFALPTVYWTNTGTLDPMVQKGLQEIILGIKTPEQLVAELDEKQSELS